LVQTVTTSIQVSSLLDNVQEQSRKGMNIRNTYMMK